MLELDIVCTPKHLIDVITQKNEFLCKESEHVRGIHEPSLGRITDA